jgi:phosphatidylglycerophosphatase C
MTTLPAMGVRTTVVWDVDGTLIRGDSLLPFLRRVGGGPALARDLAAAVLHSSGSDRRSESKQRILQRALGGREKAAVDVIANQFARDRLIRRVRPDCLRRWQWHRGRGDRMVLASASLDLYLDRFGALLGADEVICTRMEVVNGWLTGRMATPNCRGPAKVDRVREYLSHVHGGMVWVYADGRADEPLRQWADVSVRVGHFTALAELREA